MGGHFNIQTAHALSIARALSSGLLNQESQWSNLEEQAELGLGGWGDDVREHTFLLDDDLEHIWNHTSSVSQCVLILNVVVNELLVLWVVEGGPQVSWGEHFALSDGGGLLHVQPLSIVLKQELVASWSVLKGNAEYCPWSIDSHTRGSLVASGDSGELVTWPDSEDSSDGEVGINDRRSIERIEGDTEALATHVERLWDLLRACQLAASRVAKGLEQELVGQEIDGELLISERVDASRGSARGGPHLEGNGPDGLRHGHHHLSQLGIVSGLHQKLLQGVPELRTDLDGGSPGGELLGRELLLAHGLGVAEERGPDGLSLQAKDTKADQTSFDTTITDFMEPMGRVGRRVARVPQDKTRNGRAARVDSAPNEEP
jgi:hypothetical protein